MGPMLRKAGRLRRMAVRDLTAEWTISLAVCLSIAAVPAPMLVLIALYSGVISEMFSGVRTDPAAREIRLAATGASRFDRAWFNDVRAWPPVAFAVPATRHASAQGEVFAGDGRHEARANLIPIAPRDPVFGPVGLHLAGPGQAALSAGLALKLGAAVGDHLSLEITRRSTDGRGQRAIVDIEAVAIASAADFARDALFIHETLLIEIEDYKNGHHAPLLNADGAAPPPRDHFPDFRLYARDINDVAALLVRLSAPPCNLTLTTQGWRIAFALQIDRSLRLVVFAVAGLGILGLGGGLATIRWSMAARRRRTIAVLSLIGSDRAMLVGLPVLQAMILAGLGACMTVAVSAGFCRLLDVALAGDLGLAATRMTLGAVAQMAAIIFTVSAIPALLIGLGYSRLDPSDEIRET